MLLPGLGSDGQYRSQPEPSQITRTVSAVCRRPKEGKSQVLFCILAGLFCTVALLQAE